MSLDPYFFHMVLRQQQMTRAERLAAETRAARIAHEMWHLGRAAARAVRALGAARPGPRPRGATIQSRRTP